MSLPSARVTIIITIMNGINVIINAHYFHHNASLHISPTINNAFIAHISSRQQCLYCPSLRHQQCFHCFITPTSTMPSLTITPTPTMLSLRHHSTINNALVGHFPHLQQCLYCYLHHSYTIVPQITVFLCLDKFSQHDSINHMVVLHKGRYFKLNLYHKGELLKPKDIERY